MVIMSKFLVLFLLDLSLLLVYSRLFLVTAQTEEVCIEVEEKFPPQHQDIQPGKQYLMHPYPITVNPNYIGSNKLKGKVALVTGGDSGIGKAVCYHFALEGATVAFTYVYGQEEKDAAVALALFRQAKTVEAGDPIAIPTNLQYEENCERVVNQVVARFGRIDVLVNNAALQFYSRSIQEVSSDQLRTIYEVNFFAYFFMAKFALRHMREGSAIINTASSTAFTGLPTLLDYSTTKGAIVSFTRSLALQLIDRKIRVNGVVPGPVWTPLEVSSLPVDEVVTFGTQVPLDYAAQPYEIAPSYVFLASNDCSSYFTGQFLHPNGGIPM
ncbi:glucose and ribitol dehydrogenase-like [Silene latifolia]|uniref:glucose and ribitol dehydrogenase-like n=1 Tax=Silene latifolia TaxID=37657 RepID=UPI003D787183